MPTVSIIVVSFNTDAMTAACLKSIQKETRQISYEIIVVDNASTDRSIEAIEKTAPQARLIALDDNIGFAAANNLAVQEATGEFVLLLNPDTVIKDRAIERLVSFARCCPDAGVWGGRTLYADKSVNPTSCHGRMSLWSLASRASGLAALCAKSELFNPEGYGGFARDRVRGVDIVSGCFFLIKRTLWHELSGFDTRYFMYGEEADLCLRAHDLGVRPLMTPEAEIIHYGGASERVRADKMVRLLAAKSLLIADHFPENRITLAQWLLAAWPVSRLIATTVRAAILRSDSAIETARTWSEIWQRRAEWFGGYSDARQRTNDQMRSPRSAISR